MMISHPAKILMPTEGHFNRLTPAEAERLAILAEECSEVIQVVGKILRHGYDSCHPQVPEVSNRMRLEEEIGHLEGIVDFMELHGDVNNMSIIQAELDKEKSRAPYLHHQ